MTGSHGRRMVSVMRGIMMLCEACYQDVLDEKLADDRNYVENFEALFDVVCPGCEDINRPLVDDMLGSSE